MNRRLLLLLILAVSWVAPAQAERRLIVRASGGIPVVQNLCRLIGCRVAGGLGDPSSQVFLVSVSQGLNLGGLLQSLLGGLGITSVELDLPISLLPPRSKPAGFSAPGALLDRAPVFFHGDTVWHGYAYQPAADIVRAHEAHRQFGVLGGSFVAVIDTGIDSEHPALRGVVLPGYDFTRNQPGIASERADVNQSTAAVVDGAPAAVNDSTIAMLNQSTAAVVDDSSHAAFGHGTMVAGIIHLVAPKAFLVPMKAFRADGSGYLSDIIRAVYASVNANARVINMSFSMPAYSHELGRAIDFAASRQVVCVGSAGNGGKNTLVYPAALNTVMGVGSTDVRDRRSSFSNYGQKLVWVAAPGEAIVTTYPFGTYAAGWGTSFSTAFVSGATALLSDLQPGVDPDRASKAIANAKPVDPMLGNGRLDVYKAIQGLKLN